MQLSTPLFDDLQLTYNQSGRLKTLSNSGTVSDYLYDGNNLRVVKDNDGVITHYHYDLQGRLLAETDRDGTLQRAVVWYGDTPAALIDVEQSEPTFYTCTTTESFTDAAGPSMTIDTAAHSIVIQDGDYAGTYAISDEDWQVYPTAIVFSWRGGGVEFQGGLYPDYELPRRSGGLIFYEDDDEGNSQIADIYKVWKQSESGGSTIATPYQVHTDQIGAPVLLTDATGTAVWSAQYAPFGQATINSDVDGDGTEVVCNLRFPGQYFDAESGLHYNWHRYYEPRSGRYITLDPIGLDGGINLYAYVQNNPIRYGDPLGLSKDAGECSDDCPGGVWDMDLGANGGMVILIGATSSRVTFTCKSTGKTCTGIVTCGVIGPMVDLTFIAQSFEPSKPIGPGSEISGYPQNSDIENYYSDGITISPGAPGVASVSKNSVNLGLGIGLGGAYQQCVTRHIVCEE
ncbi:RHS repeat-associated core domain-containing protein [Desulfuromonas acetoxidans]|uniref:RHS repeat-associated core domain-containing protein n=1 Tax=Desulfuromonas acetoxidans TaxID=891 RepID=UPI00292E61E7|nr:RHS repeat-associated core domain-containing protein [Desulfuromonas acetoxidans]